MLSEQEALCWPPWGWREGVSGNLSQEGVSPAQRLGLWAMRGLRRVAELTFKAMRLMNKGSWTSGQEGRSQNVWVSPPSLGRRESLVSCFSFPSL